MILTMHLCGPKGDGERQLHDRALAMLQLDNRFVIEAMLRSGQQVPDLVDDLGIEYRDLTRTNARGEHHAYNGFRKMLDQGWFSCGDAAAYEAAVLSVKYGVPAHAYAEPGRGPGMFHAVYRTPTGVIDPVTRFQQKMGQRGAWRAVV